MDQKVTSEPNVNFRDEHPQLGDSRAEILAGLREAQKSLNPKWFYDQRGSELFDEITRLPEYYPTRTEQGILERNRGEIASLCGPGCQLIEPGSGSSEKVRILLDALRPALYLPMDISADFLWQSAQQLGTEYPWLDIFAVCADFNAGLDFLHELPVGKRVIFYPGSTIGNLSPTVARDFLATLNQVMGADGGALIGVDTHKSSAVLNAAYNDSAGVTADFNLNALRRVNAMLDADFDESAFEHRAFYNEARRRIEMHLVSCIDQQVRCAGERFDFVKDETIHTENSYKYTVESFAELAASAGLKIEKSWLDEDRLFSVHYLSRAQG